MREVTSIVNPDPLLLSVVSILPYGSPSSPGENKMLIVSPTVVVQESQSPGIAYQPAHDAD